MYRYTLFVSALLMLSFTPHGYADQAADHVSLEAVSDARGKEAATTNTSQRSISDERIASKAETIARRATQSRWTLRATEATMFAGIVAFWWYHRDANTEASTHENAKLSERIKNNENAIANMRQELSDQRSKLSLWHWAPSVAPIVTTIAQKFGCVTMPQILYRKLVQPVYLTDLNHFIENNTHLNRMLHNIGLDVDANFTQFTSNRETKVSQFIDNIEDVLAFIQCAKSYCDVSVSENIDRVYTNIYQIAQTFIRCIYADEYHVVSSAIQQARRNINVEVQQYAFAMQSQPIMAMLTSL